MNEICRSDNEQTCDYYEILGCHPSSSLEQINTEYKVRALKYHPDKNYGDEEATRRFKLLQNAKDVLTDPDKRKDYDLWRGSGLMLSYEKWRAARDALKMSMHWAEKTSTAMIAKTEGSSTQSEPGKSEPDVHWIADQRNKMRQKFRNYEI